MKNLRFWWIGLILSTISILLIGPALQATGTNRASSHNVAGLNAVRGQISYQGVYSVDGRPVSGSRNMVFQLFTNSACSGSPLQSITKNGVTLQNGLFHVALDVNKAHFNGQALWLLVQIDGDNFGCEPILPAPYALYSASTGALHGRPVNPAAPSLGRPLYWTGSEWAPSTAVIIQGEDAAVYATDAAAGVYGQATTTSGRGVYGVGSAGNWGYIGGANGVYGEHHSGNYGRLGTGVDGVVGRSDDPVGFGVYGIQGPNANRAGYFSGNVHVSGSLSKGGGSFEIDHPLDPENMILRHSFVESPDMMNIYNGNVILDRRGEAWVDLPDWFESLNMAFCYQLTAIGRPAPNLYIAQEVQDNRFQIAGGEPDMNVSWQLTGIRQDAWAEANRIVVEEYKSDQTQGFYLHPELYGQPATRSLEWGLRPDHMAELEAGHE